MHVAAVRRIQAATHVIPIAGAGCVVQRKAHAIHEVRRRVAGPRANDARVGGGRKPDAREQHRALVHGVPAVRAVVGVREHVRDADDRVEVERPLLAEPVADDQSGAQTHARVVRGRSLAVHGPASAQDAETFRIATNIELRRRHIRIIPCELQHGVREHNRTCTGIGIGIVVFWFIHPISTGESRFLNGGRGGGVGRVATHGVRVSANPQIWHLKIDKRFHAAFAETAADQRRFVILRHLERQTGLLHDQLAVRAGIVAQGQSVGRSDAAIGGNHHVDSRMHVMDATIERHASPAFGSHADVADDLSTGEVELVHLRRFHAHEHAVHNTSAAHLHMPTPADSSSHDHPVAHHTAGKLKNTLPLMGNSDIAVIPVPSCMSQETVCHRKSAFAALTPTNH